MPENVLCHLFALFVLMAGAAPAGKNVVKKDQEKRGFESTARARLGKNFSAKLNASETYVLCQQQRDDDHSQRRFRYVVIRLSDNRIVLEGTFRMGYVHWHDDLSIETQGSSQPRDDKGEKKIIGILSHQQ